MEETEFTLDGRVLCSDDACVGTIGPDRRCKVCGKPYEGDEDPTAAPSQEPADGEPAGTAAEASPPEEPSSEDDGEPRVCCPDDACVGVIGPDGTCGVCGKNRQL